MLLIYKGPGFIPGWPASDHDEPVAKVAKAKLASKLYRTADEQEDAVAQAETEAAKAAANAAAAAQAALEEEEAARNAEEANQLLADRQEHLRSRIAVAQASTQRAAEAAEKVLPEKEKEAFSG